VNFRTDPISTKGFMDGHYQKNQRNTIAYTAKFAEHAALTFECQVAFANPAACSSRTAFFIVAVTSAHQGRCTSLNETLDPATSDGSSYAMLSVSSAGRFIKLSDFQSYAYAKRHAVADCPQGQFRDPATARSFGVAGNVASTNSIDVLHEALSLSAPTKRRAARRVAL
jgi:hypothetical protein